MTGKWRASVPLNKSSTNTAFSDNVRQLRNEKYPRDQALAIAYRVQRDAKRKGMARGGAVSNPYAMPNPAAMSSPFAMPQPRRGMVAGTAPGRSDRRNAAVPPGSYVVPADVVSALGQGNTLAGADVMGKLLKQGPYGSAAPKPARTKAPRSVPKKPRFGLAAGGSVDDVDIAVSDGEYLIDPEMVAMIGGGDPDHGNAVLDAFVRQVRDRYVDTLKNLPGPRQD